MTRTFTILSSSSRSPEALRSLCTAFVVVGMALAIAACHPSSGNDNPEQAEEARRQALDPRQVQLVGPEVREEVPVLELVGEVRPVDTVPISSELGGRVDRVLVEIGDRVKAGAGLVEIDRATFRLQLAQAEANLEAARAELALATKTLERKADLLSDQTIPQAVYDEVLAQRDLAEAQVRAAEAARDLAARNLERSLIRAPASGVIAERLAAAGQWADVGVPLLELAAGDQVKVAARVPESWAPRLVGLAGFDFTVDGVAGRADLYSVDPVVEGSSRSFEVVGLTPSQDGRLRPGMFASVRLSAPDPVQSLWLPASAVMISDVTKTLMVDGGTIVERTVRSGRRDGSMLEIVDGLNAAEEVIADVSGLQRGLPATVVR
jgi:RND family efflux transporter MFP subunit